MGLQRDDDDAVLAEINVTPLVDVMLVLLIIFMVAAPMLHQGIKVSLPKAHSQPLPQQLDDPLILTITREGVVFLKDKPIHGTQIVERLQSLLKTKSEQMIFIKGDKEVPYGKVVELLEVLRRGGITNVGMVTEPERDNVR